MAKTSARCGAQNLSYVDNAHMNQMLDLRSACELSRPQSADNVHMAAPPISRRRPHSTAASLSQTQPPRGKAHLSDCKRRGHYRCRHHHRNDVTHPRALRSPLLMPPPCTLPSAAILTPRDSGASGSRSTAAAQATQSALTSQMGRPLAHPPAALPPPSPRSSRTSP